MRARLVVFPIKGRQWCFCRSIDQVAVEKNSAHSPSTFKDLWKKISSSSSTTNSDDSNVEVLVDFFSNKMNRAWSGLEKAPPGSIKNRIHDLGLRLMSRVKPSEIFLKSISKEVTKLEVAYPPSLNPRLVRRRLRHMALRGSAIHRRYLYGSVTLLPFASALAVLPLPNVPFFWVLFRSYSHWRALKGSERLLELVSDHQSIEQQTSSSAMGSDGKSTKDPIGLQWVLRPSKELESLLRYEGGDEGLSKSVISNICKTFDLNATDALKYRDSL